MSIAAILYLLAIIAGVWEVARTRSPGWGAVSLIAAGLFVSSIGH